MANLLHEATPTNHAHMREAFSVHMTVLAIFRAHGGSTASSGPDHCKRYRVGQNPLDAAEGSVQRREVRISPREA